MAKILFAHPLFLAHSPAEQEAASPYFPIGVLSLAAYVRDRGHEVAVFDGTFAEGPAAFVDAIGADRPDVVGISSVLPTRDMALDLARRAAEAGVAVIVGGPDATADPSAYLLESPIDVVVHHEGEQTITRLLELLDADRLDVDHLGDEAGVAFVRDGLVVSTPARPPIEDLDSLPLPARDLIDVERYLEVWRDEHGYASITVSATRGCARGCEWCRDSVHGPDFRSRSPEHLAAEIRELSERYDIDSLRLVDDVDALDREWVEAWASAAEHEGAVVPFEALNDVARSDLPMLELRDGL